MRRSKILRPLLTITFVVTGALSPATAQTLPEISGRLLCAPNPEADTRNTEARAGCIECDTQAKNSKIEENLKPVNEIVLNLDKESEKDRFVREMMTLDLMIESPREACKSEESVKTVDDKVINSEKIISFLEENQPDFKNIFNDELYSKEAMRLLLYPVWRNIESQKLSKSLYDVYYDKNFKAFKQVPENLRDLVVQGFKNSYQKTILGQKGLLPSLRKTAMAYRACHDAVKNLKEIPNINEPEKMTLKDAKDALVFTEQISAVSFINVDRRSSTSCGLTPAEDSALLWYSGSFYDRINTFLRTGTDPRSPPMSKKVAEAYAKTLNTGLAKLNNYKGTVNRGASLNESIVQEYEVGKIVTHKGYTSTSRGPGFGGNTRFEIQSKTGKYIAPLAVGFGEEEVLFQSNTRFLVKSKTKLGSGEIKIELEEVVD